MASTASSGVLGAHVAWDHVGMLAEFGTRLGVRRSPGGTRGVSRHGRSRTPDGGRRIASPSGVCGTDCGTRSDVATQIQARAVRDSERASSDADCAPACLRPLPQQGRGLCGLPLPIGHEQTISQPYVVAFMTEALTLDPIPSCWRSAPGPGNQAAVRRDRPGGVLDRDRGALAKSPPRCWRTGLRQRHVRAGDGYYGWPEHGPFDAIIGTAAAREVPPLCWSSSSPAGDDPSGWRVPQDFSI
jgi:hypothetical protein